MFEPPHHTEPPHKFPTQIEHQIQIRRNFQSTFKCNNVPCFGYNLILLKTSDYIKYQINFTLDYPKHSNFSNRVFSNFQITDHFTVPKFGISYINWFLEARHIIFRYACNLHPTRPTKTPLYTMTPPQFHFTNLIRHIFN